MPRLIDADRIDRNVVKVYDYKDQKWVNIFDIPTVEAEPVKHGHWELVRNPMMYQTVPYVQVCSQCGTAFPYKMPYCGECGAKMDNAI